MPIQINNVSVAFGATIALSDVSLDFDEKGLVGLIGPNGSGKSTLMDVLCGFISPSSGHLLRKSDGQCLKRASVASMSARLHQRLVVPHDATIEEYFDIAASGSTLSALISRPHLHLTNRSLRAHYDGSFARILDGAYLLQKSAEKIGRLSFGQQRLVALSAILLSRKPLLVLDEPLAGLAGSTREAVLAELRTVASRKLVLVAEHDIRSILSAADRILALKRGQIAIDRSAAQIDESTVLALFD